MTYTQPLLLVFLALLFAGLSGIRGQKRLWLAWTGFAGLLLVSWPPVEWLTSRPLEAAYPVRPFRMPPQAQAIVVLASSAELPTVARPYPVPDRITYERCRYAAWIYRQRPDLPIFVSGGSAEKHQVPVAATMKELLEREGVPAAGIWTEEQSKNTHENALYSTVLLRKRGIQRIALVVEARSMSRAAACFCKDGIAVFPAPSSFREWDGFTRELLPSWKAIAGNEATLHETLGFVWYWLRGWV
jgi:uncharacterized SAM-binding protein YcdF (DUF218 family)